MNEHAHGPKDDTLDDLDTEVVEDLDADDDADDIQGGRTLGCVTM